MVEYCSGRQTAVKVAITASKVGKTLASILPNDDKPQGIKAAWSSLKSCLLSAR